MTILVRLSVGRILLHLLAMMGDRCVRFHLEGIAREVPSIASGLATLTRMHRQLLAAVTLYLAQPIKHYTANGDSVPQSLAAVLHRGDVLHTQGNSRFAAVINCLTRSPWSHVSMYVGPLDELTVTADATHLIPSDFERAQLFEPVESSVTSLGERA